MRLAILMCAFLAPAHVAIASEHAAQVTPLVPGLVVDELPVRLSNINSLRFTPTGQLSALAYNGKVYLLEDTDQDGLEDRARPYWDQPTLRVPVGMAWSDRNLYVSSHGKVSLLHDADGDGRAEREEVVSEGWPPTDVASGGVDATAVTVDRDGNVYFGLMCADYSNPYRVQDGQARYDRGSLRGTILKLASDHARREVVCTGIRVPYALAFNRHGDLFVTDQEGETWLPGGNPLDELNHVLPGRHYGFPPRHPEHLPDVNDERPVVSFGPQHQSTCGLVFNDSSPGKKSFGPPSWEGNAFVAGLSRGRLWRVTLVKTPHGYVGRSLPIALSSMLLTDVALSPRGELYLACHSGPPDWGAGPEAEGRLFRLRYAEPDRPQPVLAYCTGPLEVVVAFDRPLDRSTLSATVGIEYGEHVRAADRLEVLKPPYAAVETQARAHRGKLRVVSAEMSGDQRSITFKTDPHPVRGAYALSLAGVRGQGAPGGDASIDLDYDLSGVQAKWTPRGGHAAAWKGWLPHVDTAVVQAICSGSSEHEDLFRRLNAPGQLTLAGSATLPPGRVIVRIDASAPCRLQVGSEERDSAPQDGNVQQAEIEIDSVSPRHPLSVTVATGVGPPLAMHLSYKSANDGDFRPVELARLGTPWAPPELPAVSSDGPQNAAPLAGDVNRGREIFFGEKSRCSTCHAIRGQGGHLGPDLGNLAHRDAASILRDLREPDAAINPDYLSYSVALTDGRVLLGTLRAENAQSLRIGDSQAKETVVAAEEVEQIVPQATSMMPKDLLKPFNPRDIDDLVAFLMAPAPAAEAQSEGSPARTASEIDAVLRALPKSPEPAERRALDVVLVDGVQDHGPGEHDYPAWREQWSQLLAGAPRVTVHQSRDWPSPQQWRDAEVVVLYFWNHDWSAQRLAELDAYLARGGGLVVLHSALISDNDPEALATRLGLAAHPQRTKYRHGATELHFGGAPAAPLVAGFKSLALRDETYWPMIGDRNKVDVLATAVEDGQEWPMLWTFEREKGRVFASILGHYSSTYEDPLFRILVLRGIAWTAREPLDRFQGLIGRPGEQP